MGERGRSKSVAVRGRVGRQVSIVELIRIQTSILSPFGSGFHFRKVILIHGTAAVRLVVMLKNRRIDIISILKISGNLGRL
jgi:hypothetical protein